MTQCGPTLLFPDTYAFWNPERLRTRRRGGCPSGFTLFPAGQQLRGGEALAALGAAATNNGAAGARAHTVPEAVNLGAAATVGLECSFHWAVGLGVRAPRDEAERVACLGVTVGAAFRLPPSEVPTSKCMRLPGERQMFFCRLVCSRRRPPDGGRGPTTSLSQALGRAYGRPESARVIFRHLRSVSRSLPLPRRRFPPLKSP